MAVQEKINQLFEKEKNVCLTIMGLPGQGKTYLAARLDYPAARKIIYFDVVGAFSKTMRGSDVAVLNISREPTAQELRKAFSSPYRKLVFNFRSIVMQHELFQKAAEAVAKFMLQISEKLGPFALVVDEVGELCGQSGHSSAILEGIFKWGRNLNILYRTMITQRPAQADKKILGLSNIYVSFKFTHPLDLDDVRELVRKKQDAFEADAQKLASLQVGDYLLSDINETEFCEGKHDA